VKSRDIMLAFVLFVGVIAMVWYGISQFYDGAVETPWKSKSQNVRDKDIELFHQAIRASDYQTVEKLLQKGVPPEAQDEYESNALETVVRSGNVDLLSLLAKYKANLNQMDKHGKTLLYTAVEFEDEAMVERLLSLGADPKIQDEKGETVVWKAVEIGSVELVECFVKHGVDIRQTNYAGENLMFQRIDTNAMEMVRYLKSKGLALDSSNLQKESAAFKHIRSVDHLKALLANGLDPNLVEESYGASLLAEAVETYDYRAVQALLQAGANVNAIDKYGYPILSKAIKRSNLSIVQLLLAHGADVNAIDKRGNTPCMEAAKLQKKSVVEALLATKKVNLAQKNSEGNTALQIATEIGNKDIITLLSTNKEKAN
jgi:ankyrin repeat protein